MNRPLAPGRAAKALRERFLSLTADPSTVAASFVDQAIVDFVPDEIPELGAEDLAANLADFWAYAARRRPGHAAMRLVPALAPDGARFDKLEIVQDDCAFLVDSLMGEIAELGLTVRAMFHPVLALSRDRKGERTDAGKPRRESYIQVILDPVGADREAALLEGVKATLADVRAAVGDFQAMLALMGRTSADLQLQSGGASRTEDTDFLGWLQSGHFVFLGARVYEYPRLANGDYAADEPLYKPTDGLGVLRDPERTVLRRANEPALLTSQVKHRLASDPALTVAKSNVRSRVHRRVYMDYVGIKHYGPDGKPAGEVRFVGLFTSDAYDQPVESVPLIRAKVAGVLAKALITSSSHNEKRLKTIVENYPRDELFQMTEGELLKTALGILHLNDRPRVKLFERIDPFDRFASILLFVPRERYDSSLRARAAEILADAYGGHLSAYYPSFSDMPLARVHYIIGFRPGAHLSPSLKTVEAKIAEAARTWGDRFEAAVRTQDRSPGEVAETLRLYGEAFTLGYRDRYAAAEALEDVAIIEALAPDELVHARAFRNPSDAPTEFRFKLYKRSGPAPLADVLPILESMGLKALVEEGFPISRAGEEPIWVHEFRILDERGERVVFDEVRQAFEATVVAVWNGMAENDGFNRLVLELGVSWREAALIRALARHRQQSGLDPSQKVQEEALSANPGVARLILDLFRTKFDPAIRADLPAREEQAKAVMEEIVEALQLVASLDHDRVLRRIALLIGAAKRTNFYQTDEAGQPKPYISFKVASRELADLPLPKPYREIFVWSPQVEGVHLRFGPIARGGLRWSDRRDDFRTEVLGLAKAQQVKNAVIVPVGAKGGFYPKQLPKSGAPDLVRAEGVKAYKTFLAGLLDITDNLTPDGKVITPPAVIAHEPDDPYLVVAADKGTATFSDIANGEAERYGFWLGDAFASGGSVGYDHKAMAITAKGAWEAVKRHFREIGKDIQAEPFTVIGIGDMSGDVFGNGMLLSKQIKLVAAFDHRHIFLDPDPDPAVSWAERARLFALPRSSWDDYDKKKISAGGGVYARTLKSVPLTPEVRALLGVGAEALNPTELISAILKAQAELLYLGGVGTYVKAFSQSHADVGDKANDGLRVNGSDLRVQVVGEGANLGFTQAGRIEYALKGGRIDTDAIDNSAGVDCSDHEVNIKILTGMLERTGQLTRKRRDALLRSMTDEVADHVLAHNYDQTLALSLEQMDAVGELGPHAQFMTELEQAGRLDRAVEGLPDADAVAERAKAGLGLTRPELAVLLAYGKLELSRDIVESSAPEDDYFEPLLEAYFPKPLRKYREAIQKHRLRNEIIATVVANDLVNRCGPSFPSRLQAAAACNTYALVTGYEATKVVFDIPAQWAAVAALDGKIPAAGQMALFRRLAGTLRAGTFWLARRAAREGLGVQALIQRYGHGLKSLRKLTPDILAPVDREAFEKRAQSLIDVGAPEALARNCAALASLSTAADLVDLAEGSSWPLPAVARLYHQVGAFFGFDRLRVAAGAFTAGDAFERTAVRRLIEDLLEEQAALTSAVIAFTGGHEAGEGEDAARAAVASWVALRRDLAKRARDTIADIEAAGGVWTFAKLTIANAALRELAMKQTRKKR